MQQVSGIENSMTYIVDVSAAFDEAHNYEYALTAGYAHSLSDPATKYALSAFKNTQKSGKYQVIASANVVKSKLTKFNFVDVLKQNIKTSFQVDVNVKQDSQQKTQINVQGHLERSEETSERLRNSPEAKLCQEQNSKGDHYQPACRNLIRIAHIPDHLKAIVTYKELSPTTRVWVHHFYELMKQSLFWQIKENILKNNPDGKIDLEGKLSIFERRINLKVNSKLGEINVHNVAVSKYFVEAMSNIPPYSEVERLVNIFTREHYKCKYI